MAKSAVPAYCPESIMESLPTPSRGSTDSAATGDSNSPAAFLAAMAGRTYDIAGDQEVVVAQLRADWSGLKAQLKHLNLNQMPELVAVCERLQKWMSFMPILEREREELEEAVQKARQWQEKSQGATDEGLKLFPFAEKMYRSFDDLVRCVDKLQQIYGKELDGMGIHLPMIVAVGTESAGKSSVMEMIAGQPFFPRDDATCTRLPLRLQFRRSKAESPSVSFQGSQKTFAAPKDVQNEIAAITKERTNNKDVSTEELVLNIEMGNVPELTLVDLPGLIGTAYASEGRDVKEKVRKLVMSYVQKPHAIVLAVAAANTRLRDSEVFGMVKELGAEDRTIGLLTKCDLATESRWRLESKLGNELSNAAPEEQEKAGFIPLKRGYFGMICRDTENKERRAELEQTQDAIERVKVRESQVFAKMIHDSEALAHCGVDKVYNALSDMFQDYIQKKWRPDTMEKLGEKIRSTRHEISGLRFSDRYADPPPSSDASTVKYKQEVVDRIWRFHKQFTLLAESRDLASRVLRKMPKADDVKPQFVLFNLGTGNSFSDPLQSWGSKLKAAFMEAQQAVKHGIDCLLDDPQSGTKSLPVLQDLIKKHIVEQVDSWVQNEVETLKQFLLMEIEGEGVIELVGPHRCDVRDEIKSTILRMSEEDECSICHQSMNSVAPVDVLLCCSKHFHKHCLDKAWRQAYTRQQCPLCRADIVPAPDTNEWKKKRLQEAGNRILDHVRRSVSVVLHKLQAMSVGKSLENIIEEGEAARNIFTRNLLDEAPELQQRRKELRQRLSILEQVEEEINQWSDL